MTTADFTLLNRAGLNLQAVFELDNLPAEIHAGLRRRYDPARRYHQLILVGHAGTTLWDSLKASGISSENPIDDFSVETVERWFAVNFPGNSHQVIYPGEIPVGLQALGKIAGWHHASPFMIGIQKEWGTWYAYRVLLLADTDLPASMPIQSESPCARCQEKVCVSSCPAGAMDSGEFSLDKCIDYRKAPSSRCMKSCIARVSCPVGLTHRYCDEQIEHTYSISLKLIEQYC